MAVNDAIGARAMPKVWIDLHGRNRSQVPPNAIELRARLSRQQSLLFRRLPVPDRRAILGKAANETVGLAAFSNFVQRSAAGQHAAVAVRDKSSQRERAGGGCRRKRQARGVEDAVDID